MMYFKIIRMTSIEWLFIWNTTIYIKFPLVKFDFIY